jgi:hypothetical protein
MSGLSQRYENTFGDKPKFISWSGGDNKDARANAARLVLEDLRNNPLEKDEQLNFVAHSHGVNATKQVINSLPAGMIVDNLVSLAGPVRSDYYFDSSRVKNTVNLYSNLDLTQKLAGGYISFDKSNIYFYSSDIKTGTYGEFGFAGRKMSGENVQNINVTISTAYAFIPNFISGVHTIIWQSDTLWQKEVVPRLNLTSKANGK